MAKKRRSKDDLKEIDGGGAKRGHATNLDGAPGPKKDNVMARTILLLARAPIRKGQKRF
jgi:hypothetical protein